MQNWLPQARKGEDLAFLPLMDKVLIYLLLNPFSLCFKYYQHQFAYRLVHGSTGSLGERLRNMDHELWKMIGLPKQKRIKEQNKKNLLLGKTSGNKHSESMDRIISNAVFDALKQSRTNINWGVSFGGPKATSKR